jgi:hypothetical protein
MIPFVSPLAETAGVAPGQWKELPEDWLGEAASMIRVLRPHFGCLHTLRRYAEGRSDGPIITISPYPTTGQRYSEE